MRPLRLWARRADRSPWRSAVWWALDLETSGLDARRDRILSVGMVPIRDGAIRLGEAYESRVAQPATDEATGHGGIAIHGILPSETARPAAPPLDEVLGEIADRLLEPRSILVLHAAAIDWPFLRRAFRDERLHRPDVPVVDTARLLDHVEPAERRAARHRPPVTSPALTTATPAAPAGGPPGASEGHGSLRAARRLLGLPEVPAHDALDDAVATAELMLALATRLHAERVRDLILAG